MIKYPEEVREDAIERSMTAEVIKMHTKVDYVIACPDCGEYGMEIHVDDFDLTVAGISFIECLNCGMRVKV